MDGPAVMSPSVTLDSSSPITNMAASAENAHRFSGYPLDPTMIPQSIDPNMPVSNPLLDYCHLSTLGGCNGLGDHATPLLCFYGHPPPQQETPVASTPMPMPHQPPHDTTAPLRNTATKPLTDNRPFFDQLDNFTFRGGNSERTDFSGHPSTAFFT